MIDLSKISKDNPKDRKERLYVKTEERAPRYTVNINRQQVSWNFPNQTRMQSIQTKSQRHRIKQNIHPPLTIVGSVIESFLKRKKEVIENHQPPDLVSRLRSRSTAAYFGSRMNLGTESLAMSLKTEV